jgi:hypothetical protein
MRLIESLSTVTKTSRKELETNLETCSRLFARRTAREGNRRADSRVVNSPENRKQTSLLEEPF